MMKEVGDYQVEYAKSDRSRCSITKNNIPKGKLRIGRIVQARNFDGTMPVWYSWSAFKKDKKKMKAFQTNCKKLWGIESLKPSDQVMIQSFLQKPSVSASDSNINENNDITTKSEQDEKMEYYKKEIDKVWEIKSHLKKESLLNLKYMLEINEQSVRGGEDDIIERCAFGMLFGRVPSSCGQEGCSYGSIKFFDGLFRCTGHTEWGNCSYTATVEELELDDWLMPDDIEWKTSFMNQFEFNKQKKSDYVPNRIINQPAPQKTNENIQENESKPLGNYVIAFSGKLSKKQDELKELIEKAGAKFSNTVTQSVNFLISSASEYAKDKNKVNTAKKYDIPIMEEEFIHQSIERNKKLDENERKEFYLYEPTEASTRRKRRIGAVENMDDENTARKAKKLNIKGRAAVYETADFGEDLHVYDEGGDKYGIWSVNLNKVDIQKNLNSYYILQLLEHDKKKGNYFVFRKWGRIGSETIGGSKITEYESDIDAAKDEFMNIFEKQTGVAWADRRNFKKQPGKMYPVDVDYEEENEESSSSLHKEQQVKEYKGSLDPRVRNLVSLIFDLNQFNQTMKQMEIDIDKMPLGKLSKKSLLEGFSTLNQISELLEEISRKELLMQKEESRPSTSAQQMEEEQVLDTTPVISRKTRAHSRRAKRKQRMQEKEESQEKQKEENGDLGADVEVKTPELALKAPYSHQFIELSNKFYTIVPHVFGPEGIKIINNRKILKEKIEMVETLLEMEVATTLIKQEITSEKDPIDAHYEALKTKLEPLNPDNKEYEMINTYLQNTHASSHSNYSLRLLDAFLVDREGEKKRFTEWNSVHNRMLLWHGSRITNWTGILSQGLRIAPPEAPVTGYMFGKGVYFANMSSKSANYCYTNERDNIGILVLCEVVLGDMYERLDAEYITPEMLASLKKQSTWGRGKTTPDPSKTIYIDSCMKDNGVDEKVAVPLGQGVKSGVRKSSLLYDEMIVYDVSQIKIRYLLKVKFDYL
jgi:hypothetical protein